jgi:hypothetical protein
MEIWIPEKLYKTLPFSCLLIGVFFLAAGSGVANCVFSIALVAYSCRVLLLRL